MSTPETSTQPIITPAVSSIISSGDQLLFTGTYNKDNFLDGDVIKIPVLLESYPTNKNILILNYPNSLFPATQVESATVITEQYNLTSWSSADYSVQEGYIIWGNNSPYGDSQSTSQSAILLPVLAAGGIFSGITNVAIDFTEDNRILYFYACSLTFLPVP
jgi:hypothetical protein